MESVLYKGHSSSTKLCDLVVTLKIVEIVTHVSGKCMQMQGTDGVSRISDDRCGRYTRYDRILPVGGGVQLRQHHS